MNATPTPNRTDPETAHLEHDAALTALELLSAALDGKDHQARALLTHRHTGYNDDQARDFDTCMIEALTGYYSTIVTEARIDAKARNLMTRHWHTLDRIQQLNHLNATG